MTSRLQTLVEQQIRKAEAEGKMSGLDGEGKPLPDHPEEAYLDPADAIGHRIMAEAGAVPEEVLLNRQLEAARTAYLDARGTPEEKAKMAEIAALQMKLAIAREARRAFLKS